MSKEKMQKNYGFVVAATEEAARAKAIEKFPELADKNFSLRQDEDVLDTWFSSWLWPISVFDGINNPDNKDINYYYPTSDLVTAPEIIFFWVARMIMAGYEFRGKECFKNVYFTGIVRDKLGRKMSKSLGNSPDPIELMNKYGADGVRMGMLLSSPAGNDLPFDESLCETGRNFCNKIWNAFRLIQGWEVAAMQQPAENIVTSNWLYNLMITKTAEIDDLFSKYRLSEALTLIYKLFWDDFCAWYLEAIKPAFGKPIDYATYDDTIFLFKELLKLLHPFMPFITEELYHALLVEERIMHEKFNIDDEVDENKSIMFEQSGLGNELDVNSITVFEKAKEIITNIRNIRAAKNISPKEELTLQIAGEHNEKCDKVIKKLANVSLSPSPSEGGGVNHPNNLERTKDAPLQTSPPSGGLGGASVSFMVGTTEYAVPLGNLINVEEEIGKLEAELNYQEGFLRSVMAKLSNEKFVANAKPEIVENERKKQADAESKIKAIKETIDHLKQSKESVR